MKDKVRTLIEKFKEFNSNTYGMLIVVSWIVLIICMIIKLFGGNWFELGTENDKFIAFCQFVDNTMWLKMTLACLIHLFTTYPIICIILNKKYLSIKLSIIFIPIMITKSILGWYNTLIASIIDIFITFIIPIILTRNWKRPLVVIILVLLFQVISIVFRNVSFEFNVANTFLQQSIIQVDYYLMILLFYLYNFKIFQEESEDD